MLMGRAPARSGVAGLEARFWLLQFSNGRSRVYRRYGICSRLWTCYAGSRGSASLQRLVFVKRFRELAEFSIAIGRQLQQFSEKKWLQFVKKWPPLTAYVFRGSLKPTV